MSNTKNECSLVECMQEVPDPGPPYNQKHKFPDIIIIAVTAILCGMDTWNGIEDGARSKRDWLGSFLELPGGIPSHDTINRVFQMMDPEKFHEAFFRWTGAVAGKTEGRYYKEISFDHGRQEIREAVQRFINWLSTVPQMVIDRLCL